MLKKKLLGCMVLATLKTKRKAKSEKEEKEREREKKKEKKKKRSPCLVRWRLCAKFTGFTGVANFSVR
jgi:hypothetical protein